MEFEPIPIKKKNHNKKPLMLVFTIIMFLSISFAAVYFVSNQSDTRINKLVSGLIDIEFTNQSENIYLSEDKAVPMMDALGKQNPPYEFTVKNVSDVPIRVYISLDIKNITIDKSALRYALYINNEEVITSDLSKLDENNTLYTLENLDLNESITGKIVFWIDYYYEEVNQTFDATIKVIGESKDYIYEEPVPATDTLKAKLGTGGLVGVTTDNTKTTDKEASNIREYRYSGATANNYVYFNCQDGKEQNADNCEKWRIIGIFKDEDGQEHMKIVRDEVLKDVFPATYTANGTTYKIRYIGSGDYAYWNYHSDNTYNNNWGEAGLMYWLNSLGTTDGYLKSLTSTAQNMIEETKWYLGTVTYDSTYYVKDTPKEAYNYERAVTGCADNKGPSANSSGSAVTGNSTCRVWANNAVTWNGKIGLMYPSDYGFSASDSYWNTILGYNSFNRNASNSSWLQKEANHSSNEWFLSPSSHASLYVAFWTSDGNVSGYLASHNVGVRPVLYLKSDIEVTGGEGTSTAPYILTS